MLQIPSQLLSFLKLRYRIQLFEKGRREINSVTTIFLMHLHQVHYLFLILFHEASTMQCWKNYLDSCIAEPHKPRGDLRGMIIIRVNSRKKKCVLEQPVVTNCIHFSFKTTLPIGTESSTARFENILRVSVFTVLLFRL